MVEVLDLEVVEVDPHSNEVELGLRINSLQGAFAANLLLPLQWPPHRLLSENNCKKVETRPQIFSKERDMFNLPPRYLGIEHSSFGVISKPFRSF